LVLYSITEEQKKVYTVPFDGKTSSYFVCRHKVRCYFRLHQCEGGMLKPVEQAFTAKVEEKAVYDASKADERKILIG
jgi:hypothetical protein